MVKNKYKLWLLFAIAILLFAVSVIQKHIAAMLGFLFAAIMLLEFHFAEKDISYNNPLRIYYKRRNKVAKFKKICIINFIVFFLLGILGIILGMLNIWS